MKTMTMIPSTILFINMIYQCINPIEGRWLPWSNWSDCDVTCGTGNQSRSRICEAPRHGGKSCTGSEVDVRNCTLDPCPVNGQWSPWEPWGQCSASCGGGEQYRVRFCEGIEHDGEDCNGTDIDSRKCRDVPCPVNGTWSGWSQWSACNVTCGGGLRWRTRVCENTAHGGRNCTGRAMDEGWCNTELCPVDGLWTSWSVWDDCSATCGGGFRHRIRACEGPFFGGRNCEGDVEDVEICTENPCPVDGSWSRWSLWSECGVTCGGSSQWRDRECLGAAHGGQPCEGQSTDSRPCGTDPCPIDGWWSPWSPWSACTTSCEGGTRWRTRACLGRMYGGRACEGVQAESEECNIAPCPADGVWKDWSDWSLCSLTCGGGTRHRTRDCLGPFYGGKTCEGDVMEAGICNDHICREARPWLAWTSWSLCTVSCGGGTRARTRDCLHGDIGGQYEDDCVGESSASEYCHQFSCHPIAPTCGEWRERGLVDSVSAKIQPPGLSQPFEVGCNLMINNGIGVTEIAHDHMNPGRVQGFEEPGEFVLPLSYDASWRQIDALKASSYACKQHIRWQCMSAAIKNPYTLTAPITYWANRHGEYRYYWGGATDQSDSCACGETGSCVKPGTRCNCDANDAVLRQDDGHIYYKEDLPMTEFRAGDTGGSDEYGIYTIGPLQCFGANLPNG